MYFTVCSLNVYIIHIATNKPFSSDVTSWTKYSTNNSALVYCCVFHLRNTIKFEIPSKYLIQCILVGQSNSNWYLLSYSTYYPPMMYYPFTPPSAKSYVGGYLYSIRPPFTTGLLPVLGMTMTTGKLGDKFFTCRWLWEKPILAFHLRPSVTFVDHFLQFYNKLLFSLKFVDTWHYQAKTTPSSASNLAWALPPMLQKMPCYSRILLW